MQIYGKLIWILKLKVHQTLFHLTYTDFLNYIKAFSRIDFLVSLK